MSAIAQPRLEFDVEQSVDWVPENGQISIRDGRKIDVTGEQWVIRTASKRVMIDWTQLLVPEGDHRKAIRRWVAHLLRTLAPAVGSAAFRQALHLFNSAAFLRAARDNAVIPYLAFSQAIDALGAEQRWQLHYARSFYRWSSSQRFPNFCSDVARRLDDVVIGGNRKGEAVRSANPEEGPLDAMEVATLALALRAARLQGGMPLAEQAAVWLALAFGANASQYAMMREQDIQPQYVDDQLATTLVAVPRHKKRHVKPRTEFQTRKANRFVGRLLLDLIEENQRVRRCNVPGAARPLFWRDSPYDRGAGLEEWSWHLQTAQFTCLLQRAIKRLRVLSRTGKLLQITTRRLRYSMASRMVQEGASRYAVAAALDHSYLQHVDVYFDVHSGIVDHIDRALALALGARAPRCQMP